MMIACRKCGKPSRNPRLRSRKNYTCGDCIKAAKANPKSNPNLVEVACAGCGRTVYIGASKIVPCDIYYCQGSWQGCKRNPQHRLPDVPDGYIGIHTLNAAGSLDGYTIRLASVEELESIGRARAIRDAGFAAIAQTEGFVN